MDILEYLLPDQVWALSNHLESSVAGVNPMYTTVIDNQIWYIKGATGYPWDMNTFDANYVYQSITEVSWTDPHQFKIFASKSWPTANGGIVWTTRQFTENLPSSEIVTNDSSYRRYTDCTNFTTHDLGASIITSVEGPYSMNLGGTLGVQDALVIKYMWGPNAANVEINMYVKSYGWVQWELWTQVSGIYVQKQVSAFNYDKSGGGIQPVFPCGVPKIT
jgi:hypothetical protein